MAVLGASWFSKCDHMLIVYFKQTHELKEVFNTSSRHALALKWFYKVPYLSSTLKRSVATHIQ